MPSTLAATREGRAEKVRSLFRQRLFVYGPTTIILQPQLFESSEILDLDSGWTCAPEEIDFRRYFVAGYITSLHTKPAWQKLGFGTAAMRWIGTRADEVHLPLILAAISETVPGETLINFYNRQGFAALNPANPEELIRWPNPHARSGE